MQQRAPSHHTLSLVDSNTGRSVLVRASKTVPTQAQLTSGAILCRASIDGSGCHRGAECPMVHCFGKEHVWEPIAATSGAPGLPYPPGWMMKAYDTHMTSYLEIPSTFILPTSGSGGFIEQYNERGDQVKTQFRLCKAFMEGRCTTGQSCGDIHCTEVDLTQFRSQITHNNDDETLRRFPTLPHGMIVRVFVQNSTNEYEDFTSERVLVTQGSEQYLEAYRSEGNQVPRKKMQHCAHFRMKRLCRLGPQCKFIHAVPLVHSLNFEGGNLSGSFSNANSGASTPRSELSDQTAPRSPMNELHRRQVVVRVKERAGNAGGTTSRPLSPTQYVATNYVVDDASGATPNSGTQQATAEDTGRVRSPYSTSVLTPPTQSPAPQPLQSTSPLQAAATPPQNVLPGSTSPLQQSQQPMPMPGAAPVLQVRVGGVALPQMQLPQAQQPQQNQQLPPYGRPGGQGY